MLKKITLDEFIKRGKESHPNENLDYSKVVYKNTKTPVIIIDHDLKKDGTEYGEYYIKPENFFKGQSHPLKKGQKISAKKRMTQDEFIKRLKEAHKGENLDFSKVKYSGAHSKITIIDPIYGEYSQEANSCKRGHACKKRGIEKQKKTSTYTTEKFIELAKKVWGDDNDLSYDKVNYISSQTPVIITCHKIGGNGKEHGDFKIYPDAFLQGKGCPKCGNHLSINEDEIADYIASLIGNNNIIRRDKKVLNGKELDIYIPSFNLAIEYNGIRWHSEQFNKDKYYHLNKTLECDKKGIKLIQIFEDEYILRKNIILAKIHHLLKGDKDLPIIMGRKTLCKEITKEDAKLFLENFHLQGFSKSTVYIGSFFNEKLIGVATFIKENKTDNKWIMSRMATDYHYRCQGVCGKMINFFIKKIQPNEIKTFLDRRYGNNQENVYLKLGFKLESIEKPNYAYTNGHGKRIHKFNFRKQILHKKYGFPLTMTESQMTNELGYYKIWDCGLYKYVWHN